MTETQTQQIRAYTIDQAVQAYHNCEELQRPHHENGETSGVTAERARISYAVAAAEPVIAASALEQCAEVMRDQLTADQYTAMLERAHRISPEAVEILQSV